ncbi:sigma 54-interacting transcriptional regulator [Tissierella sp. Yu-01]|uniref:sigma-54 interaction domain-containing protein n=1 Tax=Tissierella sp. Yu-01 TaxID=3035694 RepID=UPI00240D7C68|nr:sigma 54-interacting transcriptional regulator [Tissierella sp. Yu-01]WFA08582.1 sigma 54-interacting transcriptional regulator [Tissierella sp. Yu-01]
MIDILLIFDKDKRLSDGFLIKGQNNVEVFKDFVSENKLSMDDFLKDYKCTSDLIDIDGRLYMFQIINMNESTYLLLSRKDLTEALTKISLDYFEQGMQIYDKNGYFLYGNKKSEKLEEYNSENFKGKHVLELYDLNEEFSTVLTILRTRKPVINRCDRFKVKSGKTLTTINTGFPIIIKDKLYGAIVFESDITAVKSYQDMSLDFESYLKSKKSDKNDSMFTFADIIYESNSMNEVIEFAKKVSLTDSSVLIRGDTGTGKELFAQSIHTFGTRRFKPFIDVNCSAIPDSLFESLFFGTEVGAFTGSVSKTGFFEQANGGTLFLDEINSISLDKQAKLLRVLEEKKFQRLGGSKKIDCDIRIIAATNEDLQDLVKSGRMREDFYYRIAVVKIIIPSLRERKTDIKILSNYFLSALYEKYSFGPSKISDEVLKNFLAYDWPGNVRELRHIIESSFNNSDKDDSYLAKGSIPEFIQNLDLTKHKDGLYNSNLNELLNNYEKEIIIKQLKENDNNITQTAASLGISRQNLQYRIKKNGIRV